MSEANVGRFLYENTRKIGHLNWAPWEWLSDEYKAGWLDCIATRMDEAIVAAGVNQVALVKDDEGKVKMYRLVPVTGKRMQLWAFEEIDP